MKGRKRSHSVQPISLCLGVLVLTIAATDSSAQDPPVNATLVGTWDGYGGLYSDVWAEGDYAYLPNFALGDGMSARVHIVDISNPQAPVLDETFFLPSPNTGSSPQDVKTGDGLLFIGLEGGTLDSVSIVDIRDPNARVEIATVRIAGLTAIHSVFYDNGFLYITDSSTPRVGIIDLTSFDPDNPPATPITTAAWILQNVGSVFVHDITVAGGRLYAAAWNSGLWVYDVSDVANSMPTLMGTTPGGSSTHAMWPTGDGKFVVTGEERFNGGLKVYEIDESPPGTLNFTLRDVLVLSSDAHSVHNQIVIGNRLYVSWYEAGLRVFDINCTTGKLEFVASYDTSVFSSNGFFNGCWGVNPFLGDDKIVLSDLENGMFIIDVTRPLEFGCPVTTPKLVDPTTGGEVRVEILSGSDSPDPATGQLFVQVDGGAFQASALQQDVSEFVGQIVSTPCGSDLNYYISIDTLTGGQTVTYPGDAPATTFSAISAVAIVPTSTFDFEDDTGWTVSGPIVSATSGRWESGVPVGEVTWGDPNTDFDGSGKCFLTGNVAGNADVDGGTTILTSPQFDLTQLAFPRISYARWYSNSAGASPQADTFVVEVTDNGVDWVNLETVGPSGSEVGGGWFKVSHELPAGVAQTATVQVRFSASDLGSGSLVEAAIDDFAIEDLFCPDSPTIPVVTGGIASRYIAIAPAPVNPDPVAFRIECGGVTEWVQLVQTDYDDGGGVQVNIGIGVPDCTSADFLTVNQWTSGGASALYVTGQAVAPNSKPTVVAVSIDCAGVEDIADAPIESTWQYCDSSGDGEVTFFDDLFKQFTNTSAGGGGAGFLGADPGIEVDTQGNSPTVPDQQVTFFNDIFQCFLATTVGGGATWSSASCP